MDNPDGGLPDDFQPLPQPLQHYALYNLPRNAFAQVDDDLRTASNLDRGNHLRTPSADLAGALVPTAELLQA